MQGHEILAYDIDNTEEQLDEYAKSCEIRLPPRWSKQARKTPKTS